MALDGGLRGLIEEFVTRNGTDNGYTRATLEQNVAAVMAQLLRKEVVVVYDGASLSANIVPSKRKLQDNTHHR